MKRPIARALSTAIALPIAIVSLILANPASAEQIDRSSANHDESVTAVTDLNLSIPVDAQQSTSGSKKSPANRQLKKSDSKSRRNSNIATNTQNSAQTNLKIETPIQSTEIREQPKLKSTPKRKIATNSLPPFDGNYLRLVRNPRKGTNDVGNPIYTLEAYVNGVKHQSFNAVSGTANSQNRDRDVPNVFAPLPDGIYQVSDRIVPSNIPEVGRTFISIFPQFSTQRQDLGIHLDPSFNKRNGHDGTAGCIGLTKATDRDAVNNFVAKYHPRKLIVKIDPDEN
jgi:hypothetical protein